MSAEVRPQYVWFCADCCEGAGDYDDEESAQLDAGQHNLDNEHGSRR